MSQGIALVMLAIAAGLWGAIESGRKDVLVGYLYLVALATLIFAGILYVMDPCPVCPEVVP